jgi:2-polyprenyl-3-methyl-5-hydroxy-6-metoxy-1,4-benzoquinol methylase
MEFEKIQKEGYKERSDKHVTNTMYVEKGLELGTSTLTRLQDPLSIFERGSFTMTMDFQELLKYEFLFSQISELEYPKILDVGCSHSALRTICYRSRKPIQYTGIDIDKEQIEQSFGSFTLENSEWYVMNASGKRLPFEDTTFDIVIASDVIEHVNTPEDGLFLLKECIRVSKNLIYVSTPNRKHDSPVPTVRPPQYDSKGKVIKGHLYEYSNQEMLEALSKEPVEILGRYGTLITQANLKKEFEKQPELKAVLDKTLIRSNAMQDCIFANFFPDSSKDVMYILKRI